MPGVQFRSWAWRYGQAGVVATLGLVAFATVANAQSRRHAALVVDGNTGRVISESGADEPRYPASLTKMMTLYVVFDLIEQKKLSYDTRITFSDAATRVQPTKLGVREGGSITVLEAAKALVTKSANDASVALAEHIAGSEPKFAALMTQTARRIGMKSSTFKNAHGLPDSEQVTTARDMITLGLRLQDDFPKHYPIFSTREFNHGGNSHRNHNTMLLTYEGTDGIKTGYIGSSGFNLVANVRRNDKHVIGVVFGGATAGARNNTMKTLLNIALFKASPVKTRDATPIARAKPVPQPSVAARPAALQPVVTAQAPAPVQPRIVEAPKAAPAPVVAAQAPAAAAEPDIQVARVRPMLVAPRPPKQAALPVEAPVAPPQPQPAPLQQAIVIQTPPLATGFAATAPTAAAQAPQQRGNPPSTFQAQASNLTRAAPAPQVQALASPPHAQPRTHVAAIAPPPGASRLNGPTPVQPSANGIHLQVGAFATKAEADRHLAQVQSQAAAVLGRYAAVAIEAVSNGKTVYRARFTGVDASAAGNICNDLRRRQIDCMVTRPE